MYHIFLFVKSSLVECTNDIIDMFFTPEPALANGIHPLTPFQINFVFQSVLIVNADVFCSIYSSF